MGSLTSPDTGYTPRRRCRTAHGTRGRHVALDASRVRHGLAGSGIWRGCCERDWSPGIHGCPPVGRPHVEVERASDRWRLAGSLSASARAGHDAIVPEGAHPGWPCFGCAPVASVRDVLDVVASSPIPAFRDDHLTKRALHVLAQRLEEFINGFVVGHGCHEPLPAAIG